MCETVPWLFRVDRGLIILPSYVGIIEKIIYKGPAIKQP